ncbi:transcription elongation factor A N-terminal and central domain-containing protein isoform X1 [Ascaphus truei]|uniref:transcription elongation factor A N-terminal and central domain-containing protein isoform X1 n=1 Tax=Ascaphus truei TaxID=8439 RepID=UPI003F5A5902
MADEPALFLLSNGADLPPGGMLAKKDIGMFTTRALQVESLLPERKYEDIAFHLTHFEVAEVTSEILQQTDIIRAVYRVLKSCPQGALKNKAKCLLSKWKALYRKDSIHAKNIEANCMRGDKEVYENLAMSPTKLEECSGQEMLAFESTSSLQSTNETQKQKTCIIDPNTQENYSNLSKPVTDYPGQKKVCADDSVLRTKCTDLLYRALTEPTECQDREEKAKNFANEIEENIYALHAGNDKKYRNCIRSKVSNLKNSKNPHLKEHIFSGALSTKAFAEMSVMEMANDELRKLRASYTEACVQEHQMPQGVDGVQTNKIKCRRCENFDCTVTMISRGTLFLPGWVRTGNPDEEMITFVICNECGEKWYHNRWVCL